MTMVAKDQPFAKLLLVSLTMASIDLKKLTFQKPGNCSINQGILDDVCITGYRSESLSTI
jgi:hypothetical protein